MDQGFCYAGRYCGYFFGRPQSQRWGQYYFLPFDAEAGDLEVAALPSHQISSIITRIKGKKILFLDTCHSGNAAKNGFNDINGFINEQSSESHAWVYTATTGNEVAVEDPALNNGAFTKALVLGISGEAAFQEEETITTAGLYHFISARVARLTAKHQHPVAGIPAGVPDFVLAKVRKESRASD